jgi:hypothetical protein
LVRLRHVLEEEVGWISEVRLGQEEKRERNEEYGINNTGILGTMIMIMRLTNL